MVWPAIPGGAALLVVVVLIWNHTLENPEILDGFADAALVRCEISDLLYEKMVDVGLNQDQIAKLDAMMQGREVAARDVRDVGGHVKHVVNAAKWDMLCGLAGH